MTKWTLRSPRGAGVRVRQFSSRIQQNILSLKTCSMSIHTSWTERHKCSWMENKPTWGCCRQPMKYKPKLKRWDLCIDLCRVSSNTFPSNSTLKLRKSRVCPQSISILCRRAGATDWSFLLNIIMNRLSMSKMKWSKQTLSFSHFLRSWITLRRK